MKHFTILKILCLTILFILFNSCDNSKNYNYVEVELERSIFGGTERNEKDPIVIKAKSDSIAYLEAYQRFCISEKVNKDMEEVMGNTISTPISFKIFDEQGTDISQLVDFDKIDSLKNNIRTRVFNGKNNFEGMFDENQKEKIAEHKNSVKIDSTKINELEKYFNIERDEFDPNGLVWYKPKSAPKYINRNGIYCYFQTKEGVPSNLRLKLQYHSDDWLFFKKVQFAIDGKAFEIIPTDTERDSGNGGRIWEWFDAPMRNSNTELLDALANAKSAKMKLIGSQYYDTQTITSTQIKEIRRVLELYKAMGGVY